MNRLAIFRVFDFFDFLPIFGVFLEFLVISTTIHGDGHTVMNENSITLRDFGRRSQCGNQGIREGGGYILGGKGYKFVRAVSRRETYVDLVRNSAATRGPDRWRTRHTATRSR